MEVLERQKVAYHQRHDLSFQLSGLVKYVTKSRNHEIAVNVLSLQCSEDTEWVTISIIELSWQLKCEIKKGFNFACCAIQYPVYTCKEDISREDLSRICQ